MWSTGEGNGKPLQYYCLENPMNSMKRQNDRILKEKSVGAQYATGHQWRNNSRKNEEMEPKQHPVVNATGGVQDGKTHAHPWLIHVDVWQKTPQYCKVISLQLQ